MQSVTQSVNQLVSHSVHLLMMCPTRNKGEKEKMTVVDWKLIK